MIRNWSTGVWHMEPAHQPFAEFVRLVSPKLKNRDTGEPLVQYAHRSMIVEMPAGARSTDPDTAHQAAVMPRDLADKHLLVLQLLHDHGPSTDWDLSQLAARHGMNLIPTSIGKRRQELKTVGLVMDSGRRRATGTGATAICWMLSQAGKQALAA